MNINNIYLIDQRLPHFCLLILQFNGKSTAAGNSLVDLIITLQIKLIEAINAFEKRLLEQRPLIPLYKARCTTYKLCSPSKK